MEGKMKIAFIAIAIVATVAVAGVGVSVFMNNDGGSAERPTYNADVNVKIGDEYKSFSGTGKTVKEILESALGDDVKVGANGNVSSYKEQKNDSDHSWVVFRYQTPKGWVNATDDNLAEGATLALEFSEKVVEGGKTTYKVPTLEVKKTVWFFIQIPALDDIKECVESGSFKVREDSNGNPLKSVEDCYNELKGWTVNAGLNNNDLKNGFWIKGTGSYMNEALANGLHDTFFSGETMTVEDDGVTIDYCINGDVMHSSLKKSDLYGWFVDFLGWGDTQLNNGDWTYWSQYTYNPNAKTLDDARQWEYDQWALGFYDMDLYKYVALVLQTTPQKDGGDFDVDVPIPTPSAIPEELKA